MFVLALSGILILSVVSAAILFHVGARRGEDRWMYAWTGLLLGPIAFLLLLNGGQSSSHRL